MVANNFPLLTVISQCRHTSFYCVSQMCGCACFLTTWRQDPHPAKRLWLVLLQWSGTNPQYLWRMPVLYREGVLLSPCPPPTPTPAVLGGERCFHDIRWVFSCQGIPTVYRQPGLLERAVDKKLKTCVLIPAPVRISCLSDLGQVMNLTYEPCEVMWAKWDVCWSTLQTVKFYENFRWFPLLIWLLTTKPENAYNVF